MKAEIIAVGTELLLGQIVNTNARFIAQMLPLAGIDLFYQTVVGDNAGRLKQVMDIAFSRAQAVILTGGLGPTKDDMTKEAVAEYFGKKLVCDKASLKKIEEYFVKNGRKMTENNKKQAYMPEGCIILPNNNGTAPGCIIEENGKIAVMLPGPPNEMEPMFTESVMPYFLSKSEGKISSLSLRIMGVDGMGESKVESEIADLTLSLNPTVATYAKTGEVEIRITAKSTAKEEAQAMIAPVAEEIRKRFGAYVYGSGNITMAEAAVKKLKEHNLKVSAAESCTGGLLAGEITSVAGSSEVFEFGFVTYANRAKTALVDVSETILSSAGAVSEETARLMAEGARKKSGADIGVSATGIAGPGGGTEEKPVGLVYIALADKNGTKVKKLNLSGSREKVRRLTVINILAMIINTEVE